MSPGKIHAENTITRWNFSRQGFNENLLSLQVECFCELLNEIIKKSV